VGVIAPTTFTHGEQMTGRLKYLSLVPVLLLPLLSSCALLHRNRVPPERGEPATQQDSVSTTAMSLYRLVREIDAEGRTIKALPSWLSDAQSAQRAVAHRRVGQAV
jgi:hypothetical protein